MTKLLHPKQMQRLHLHGIDCTCEHCSYQHHGVTFRLTMDVHDGATVGSARGDLLCDQNRIRSVIANQLQQLADRISAEGGIIGHIKSAVELNQTIGYSITLDTVQEELPKNVPAAITLDAIVFGIEPERLEELIKEILHSIAEIHCSF